MISLDGETIMSVAMCGGLVGVLMWILQRLGGSDYQTPIIHYRGIMNIEGARNAAI